MPPDNLPSDSKFRRGDTEDFERMLRGLISQTTSQAAIACHQVQSQFALAGAYHSSRLPISMEQSVIPDQDRLLSDAMRMLLEFADISEIEVLQLVETSRQPLIEFGIAVAENIFEAANGMPNPPSKHQLK